MANYNQCFTTNFFQVEDKEIFYDVCELFDVEIYETEYKDEDVISLCSSGWVQGAGEIFNEDERYDLIVEIILERNPEHPIVDDILTYDVIEIEDVLPLFLKEGWVAIIQYLGHEKLNYVRGRSIAINSDSGTKSLCLDDIFSVAHELGDKITSVSSVPFNVYGDIDNPDNDETRQKQIKRYQDKIISSLGEEDLVKMISKRANKKDVIVQSQKLEIIESIFECVVENTEVSMSPEQIKTTSKSIMDDIHIDI